MSSPSPGEAKTPSRRRRTPRTPRSRQFKFSTTGTEVAHIETIEADPPLRTFPQVLTSQIRRYLRANAGKGNEIELTFARNGNTKLNVSGEGFPAYFVIPETEQKLDAGRYRYGLVKQSPLIVVVQQKEDSTVNFNNGQPAIVLYHGKHSSIEGPNKVSKWAVWGFDGLRSDIIVWRIAEGARLVKPSDEVADEDNDAKAEEDGDMAFVDRSSPMVYQDARSIFQESSINRQARQQGQLRAISSPWSQLNAHYPPTPDDVPTLQDSRRQYMSTHTGYTRVPIDPQLLAQQTNTGFHVSNSYLTLTDAPNNVQAAHSVGGLLLTYPTHTQTSQHQPTPDDVFHFFNCTCRGFFVERRNAEMAAATDRVLAARYSCVVNFSFRASMTCETQVTKTLEDCRSMSQVFAYGRLHRTILLDHNVISVHFNNGTSNTGPCYMVVDDVDHWKTLISLVEQELFIKEKEIREKGKSAHALELVVLDEGY